MPAFYEPDPGAAANPAACVLLCVEQDTWALLFDRGALPPAFFDLSTGVAGELVQKLVNYHVRMAAVVPDLSAHSQSFRDFAREANVGRLFRFFATRGDALAWLEAAA